MKSLAFSILIWTAGWLSVAAAETVSTRVALLCAGCGETGKDLLMLTDARLGEEPRITLLDRREIERVLREQKLTLSGLVDTEQALELGKVLRAEVFVVLEMLPNEKTPLGLVAFDAQTGVRLHDVTLVAEDLAETARVVAQAVKSACEKRNRVSDPARTVCLVSVRNADLPRVMDSRCQTVGTLLERLLVRSEGLTVLERKRLEHVNRERALPTVPSGGPLTASLLTIDLEIGRGPQGKGLRATALVSDAAGKCVAESRVTVPDEDTAALASGLTAELLESLNATPPPPIGDRTAEARRFCREARILREHRNVRAALSAAESAHALAPETRECSVELATELVEAAYCLLFPDRAGVAAFSPSYLKRNVAEGKEAFELAKRALDLRYEEFQRNQGPYRGDQWWFVVDLRLGELCRQSVGEGVPVSLESRPAVLESPWPTQARPAVQAFREAYHRQLMARLMRRAVAGTSDPGEVGRFAGEWINGNERRLVHAAPNARQYISDLNDVMGRWLEAWERQPTLHNKYFDEALCFFVLDRDPNPNPAYSVWAPRHFVLSPRDYAPLGPLFQTMREHPVPLVQEYGMWAQIWLARHCGGSGPLFDDFKKLIHSRIEHPNNDSADTARLHHYRTMLRALRHLPMEAGQRRHERLELANYMLDRGEMVGGVTPFESGNVIWEALSVQPNTREEAEQQAALVRRAKAALDGKVKIIADWDNDKFVAGMRLFLEKQQQTMGATWPDLAPAPSEVPWKVARELVKCGGGERLLGPVLCDGSLLFVKSPKSIWGAEFEAFSASLDAMTVRSLGKAPFSPERKPPRRCGITTTCAGGGYYFVSPIDDGIVAFSLTGGSRLRIGEAQGLPTNQVRAMAWLDGKLYAALAGGYLVRCDLTGQSCEILASSSRKQRLSPFDDSPPFSVPYMVADVKRHRLLFATHTPARPEGYQKTNGLWCYDPARKSFERLLEISPFAETSGGSTIVDDKLLLWHHVSWVLQVDLKTGKPSLLYSFNHHDQIVPGLNSAKTPYNNLPMVFGPYAEIDGWLWWVHGFGRMSKETNFTQTLPWPGGTQVHDAGFMYLEPIGEGESLIVGDESSFWLLTLKDASNL